MTKAIGVARQSKGDEASFSLEAQREKIEDFCGREGLALVDVQEEPDTSGGTSLAKRTGLRAAVETIEAGRASVLVVAYFTRLARSLDVQREVVRRVEAAGGRVHSLDVGAVTHGNAGAKLTGTFLGGVAEHVRDVARDYQAEAHARLIAEGKWIGGAIPYGYTKGADGRLTVVPEQCGARPRGVPHAGGGRVSFRDPRLPPRGLRYA